jgi:hypothetical protein
MAVITQLGLPKKIREKHENKSIKSPQDRDFRVHLQLSSLGKAEIRLETSLNAEN